MVKVGWSIPRIIISRLVHFLFLEAKLWEVIFGAGRRIFGKIIPGGPIGALGYWEGKVGRLTNFFGVEPWSHQINS